MKGTLLAHNIRISYIISIPIGLFTVFLIFAVPVTMTGEGLITIILIETYGWSILGLLISFIVSIWIGSKRAHLNLVNGMRLIKASFNFSLATNTIIWATFIVITVLNNINSNILLILLFPFVAYITSVIVTTFTIGLLICYLFDRNIKRLG